MLTYIGYYEMQVTTVRLASMEPAKEEHPHTKQS